MKYRKGYKIQLAEDEVLILSEAFRGYKIHTKFISLEDCALVIRDGYASDLASGPTIDTENTKVPSVGHDALYELIRQGLLPFVLWKEADKMLYRWLRGRDTAELRIWYWKKGLDWKKGACAHPKNKKKVYTVK